MSKLAVLKELFADVKYRASQQGFTIETRFDNERSAIQILRRSDNAFIYRIIVDVENKERRFLRSDVEASQVKAYNHFISYMSFYGIITVSHSFDQEQLELAEKQKKEYPAIVNESVKEKPKAPRKKKEKKNESL